MANLAELWLIVRTASSRPVKLGKILQRPRIKPDNFKVLLLCQGSSRQSHIVFERIQIKGPCKRMLFVCQRGHFVFASRVHPIANIFIWWREKDDFGAWGRSLELWQMRRDFGAVERRVTRQFRVRLAGRRGGLAVLILGLYDGLLWMGSGERMFGTFWD